MQNSCQCSSFSLLAKRGNKGQGWIGILKAWETWGLLLASHWADVDKQTDLGTEESEDVNKRGSFIDGREGGLGLLTLSDSLSIQQRRSQRLQ